MKKIAIIGAGAFGSLISLEASKKYKIDLFESNREIMLEATANNLNRVHAGYHYPRDIITTLQSKESYGLFCKRFSESINKNFKNYYLISKMNSKVSSKKYLKFMKKNDLKFKLIKSNDFFCFTKYIDLIAQVDEYVYDIALFRNKIKNLLENKNINLMLLNKVTNIKKKNKEFIITSSKNIYQGYDYVINTSYKNFNHINNLIDKNNIPKIKYQYTFSSIAKFDNKNKFGITLLDGKFFTILPFGMSDKHLLYDVENSVIKSRISKLSNLTEKPLNFDYVKAKNEKKMLKKIETFLPGITVNIKLKGYLHACRVLKPYVEKSDERRLSMYSKEGLISVFSSKVDHSILAAKRINEIINQ